MRKLASAKKKITAMKSMKTNASGSPLFGETPFTGVTPAGANLDGGFTMSATKVTKSIESVAKRPSTAVKV